MKCVILSTFFNQIFQC